MAMRKIVVPMSVSLDGFFEGPDHDIGWHLVDDELHEYVNEHLGAMSAFLEGRVSYQLMEEFWPTADQDPAVTGPMREFSGIWRGMPKIVFSRTLEKAGDNATVRHDVDPDEIRALKKEPGGDMALGGADLVATFREHDLIDEYRLYVNPVLLGAGRRLFGPAESLSELRLVETRTFGNGVVMLRHERAR
jgi:dihydrofolate reductase